MGRLGLRVGVGGLGRLGLRVGVGRLGLRVGCEWHLSMWLIVLFSLT